MRLLPVSDFIRAYEAAKKEATDRIIKRQSRGSVHAQNGWYMSAAKLLSKSREADKQMRSIRQAMKRACS